MTFLTGLLYPLLITLIAQTTMKPQADGEILLHQGKKVGSSHIAQKFESPKYFWPRPSAIDYNPLPSGGSNLGPTSASLKKTVEERKARFHSGNIPSELLFASGSGLDPHITSSAAYFQIDRVAQARGLDSKRVKELVDRLIEKRRLGFLGEPCLNVLKLNLALDEL